VDAAVIGVELVDEAGFVVPDDDRNVTFTIGPASPAVVVGTANGDPADHVVNTSPTRMTFHGR
jgi:hypothetical protein